MRISSTSASRGRLGFILAFAIVVGAGAALGEWYCRTAVANWNVEARRTADIYLATTSNVIIGDSQLYYGFVPSPAIHGETPDGTTYEMLAISGESGLMMNILAKEYFKFRTPRRIIVPAAPQVFAANRIARGYAHMDGYFKQNNIVQHALGYFSYLFESGISNFMLARFEKVELPRARLWPPALVERWATVFQEGAGPRAAAYATNAEYALARDCAAHRQPNWSLNSQPCRTLFTRLRFRTQQPVEGFETTENFMAFRDMIDFLAGKGAELCFIRMPTAPEMTALIEQDRHYAEAFSALKEMAEKAHARYVDWRDLPVNLTPDLFLDTDHLVEAGSIRYAPVALRACFG